MSVLVGIVGLGLLVLIHEAGHFFTARAVGMSPRKFYVGFPPPLVKTVRNGIEYGIGAIPLGGYVKIPGMHRPAPADLTVRVQRSVAAAPELTAPVETVKRDLERNDYETARTDVDALDRALRAAGQPTGVLDDVRDSLAPDAYWRQPVWKRILVIFAGPGTNLVFAIVVFAVLFMIGGGKATTTVGEVIQDTPAARAGLHAGDRILSINARRITNPVDIPATISDSHGRRLTLVVQRGSQTVTIGPVRPEKTSGVYRLGFVLKGKGLPPHEAAWQAVRLTGILSWDIVRSLGSLVHHSGREQISSPVGIVQGSSAAVKQGLQSYLWVLGLISLSLALLNLLPLLPLDGGHIFFSLLEAVRHRAVPREVYERVSAIGIALVLLLFFIGLSNDVGRLGGG
jgi:regulator of sigma E protease